MDKLKIGELFNMLKPRLIGLMAKYPALCVPPLTAAAYFGTSFSTVTTSTQIDLSAAFGLPAGIRMVQVSVGVRDSAAWGSGAYYFGLGPSATYWYAMNNRCYGGDWVHDHGPIWVPCDANGDIWYQASASGTNTLDVWIRVWAYRV